MVFADGIMQPLGHDVFFLFNFPFKLEFFSKKLLALTDLKRKLWSGQGGASRLQLQMALGSKLPIPPPPRFPFHPC